MKILVCAYDLVVPCGTVVNTIELAAARPRPPWPRESVLFAAPGPMVKLVEEEGLHFLPAARLTSSIHVAYTDARAARRGASEHPDLIHAWDWQPVPRRPTTLSTCLMRVPMVVTWTSM